MADAMRTVASSCPHCGTRWPAGTRLTSTWHTPDCPESKRPVAPSRPARDGESREQRGHRIDQRFISDVRRAYNLRGGETDAWVVQRVGNAIAELNAQRTTLGEPSGPHLIQSSSPARDGETRAEDYRAGYSTGYSDAVAGRPMRYDEAAEQWLGTGASPAVNPDVTVCGSYAPLRPEVREELADYADWLRIARPRPDFREWRATKEQSND